MDLIDLKLTPARIKELSSLSDRLHKELITEPYMMSKETKEHLKRLLKDSLEAYDLFRNEIWEEALIGQRVVYIHSSNDTIKNLPWQLLSEERPGLVFTTGAQKSLSKYDRLSPFPLKILIMVSSPNTILEELNYEEEERRVIQAFGPLLAEGKVEIDFTHDGSLQALRDKLISNKFHILHFTGHAHFENNEGKLILEDHLTGEAIPTPAIEFNKILSEAETMGQRPELVVLSACQSAQYIKGKELQGISETLIKAGVPSVIAMSSVISDKLAIEFEYELYKNLAEGGSLTNAYSNGIHHIRKEEQKYKEKPEFIVAQWLVPRLLLNYDIDFFIDKSLPYKKLDFNQLNDITKGRAEILNSSIITEGFNFIGRRKERREAHRELGEGNSIIINGAGGLGKTTLARAIVYRMMLANPGLGIIQFKAEQDTNNFLDTVENYLNKYLKHYEFDASEYEKEPLIGLKKACEIIQEKNAQVIFVFDNLEDFLSDSRSQEKRNWNKVDFPELLEILFFLCARTSYPLILTSRYAINDLEDYLYKINLNEVPFWEFYRKCKELGIEDIYSGYSHSLKEKGNTILINSHIHLVRELYRRFGANYRCLEFFFEIINKLDWDKRNQLINNLIKLEIDALEKNVGSELYQRMSENFMFSELIGQMTSKEKRAICLLSKFRIPVYPMALNWDKAKPEFDDKFLEGLVNNYSLVEKTYSTKSDFHLYSVTPIVKGIIGHTNMLTECVFDPNKAAEYHEYLAKQGQAENALKSDLEALNFFIEAGNLREIKRLSLYIAQRLSYDRDYDRAVMVLERVEKILGSQADCEFLDTLIQSLTNSSFKNTDRILGYCDRVINMANKSIEDWPRYKCFALMYKAKIKQPLDSREARNIAKEAIKIAEQHLPVSATIKGKIVLADILYRSGDINDAIDLLIETQSLCEEIDKDVYTGEYNNLLGSTINQLGLCYAELDNKNDIAIKYYEKAVEIALEIEDNVNAAIAVASQAELYQKEGNYNKALELYEDSVGIFKQYELHRFTCDTYKKKAQVHYKMYEWESAIESFKEAYNYFQFLDEYRQGSFFRGAQIIQKIGDTYFLLQNYSESINYYKFYVDLLSKSKEGWLPDVLINLCRSFIEENKMEEAKGLLDRIFKLDIPSDPYIESQFLLLRGVVLKQNNEYGTAKEYFQKALSIIVAKEEKKHLHFILELKIRIGEIDILTGQRESGLESFQRIIKDLEQENLTDNINVQLMIVLRLLGNVLFENGYYEVSIIPYLWLDYLVDVLNITRSAQIVSHKLRAIEAEIGKNKYAELTKNYPSSIRKSK